MSVFKAGIVIAATAQSPAGPRRQGDGKPAFDSVVVPMSSAMIVECGSTASVDIFRLSPRRWRYLRGSRRGRGIGGDNSAGVARWLSTTSRIGRRRGRLGRRVAKPNVDSSSKNDLVRMMVRSPVTSTRAQLVEWLFWSKSTQALR